MAKKVLRYTEDEFVTLLENIVNRVKKEKINESFVDLDKVDRSLNESRRPNRKRPTNRRK